MMVVTRWYWYLQRGDGVVQRRQAAQAGAAAHQAAATLAARAATRARRPHQQRPRHQRPYKHQRPQPHASPARATPATGASLHEHAPCTALTAQHHTTATTTD